MSLFAPGLLLSTEYHSVAAVLIAALVLVAAVMVACLVCVTHDCSCAYKAIFGKPRATSAEPDVAKLTLARALRPAAARHR